MVVKGHPSHPGTGELVAQCIAQAVNDCRLHPGTFAFLHAGGAREKHVGEELVQHRGIRAVGFTGSLAGGTALARLGAGRVNGADPIPVFAEMGSTNPVFVLVGEKPIRASRRSAEWCLKGVDQCWSQKQRFIKADEMNLVRAWCAALTRLA